MKMTVELPDHLMRRMKIRAINEHKKLKEIVAEMIEQGLRNQVPAKRTLPKPLKLRDGFIPSTEDIEAAIEKGRRY